jgi:hypothetical protein
MAAKTPLEDPGHEKELFVSEIAGIGAINGNFVVTLASIRFDEPIGALPPKAHRVVVGRLILTNVAAGQLAQGLQRIAAQIEAAGQPVAGQIKN